MKRSKGQGNIGVLMGGVSAEREISLRTGEAITKALMDRGYDVCSIDVGYDIAEQLISKQLRVAFIALHGRFGEDGTIQGMLEIMRIPYTGSGVLASALSMDKIMSKRIFTAHAIPTPASHILQEAEGVEEALEKLDFSFPVVVKPASEGSTIGVTVVHNRKGLAQAIEQARRYDHRLLLEEYIKGKEITLGVLNGQPLPIIEIAPKCGFYDYRAKYTKGETEYILPARIPPKAHEEAERSGLKAYEALGCEGCARVDMMTDEKADIFVLEVNSMPGMTETSLVPKAAQFAGIDFPELVERILRGASLKA
ncbi:MAG: D-alanine--D-alanine ligase [Syntrophobacterales bacterium]|nr:MAG: D-alanine--D-alanine ligase [Syntrophobacterales bacterium]